MRKTNKSGVKMKNLIHLITVILFISCSTIRKNIDSNYRVHYIERNGLKLKIDSVNFNGDNVVIFAKIDSNKIAHK